MTEVTLESMVVTGNQDRLQLWLFLHEKNMSPWHSEHKHPFLVENVSVLFGDSEQKRKVLIPMCGKAVEISWFAELGHYVVGIEASSLPIEEFFRERNLQYSVDECEEVSGQVYKAEGLDITIYCCDIFKFTKNSESEFDVIWDRGAFGAIYPRDRKEYAQLMSSLMTKDCHYFASVWYYGDKYREEMGYPANGPPYFIPLDQVQEFFAPSCKVEMLVKLPVDEKETNGKDISQDAGECIFKITKC